IALLAQYIFHLPKERSGSLGHPDLTISGQLTNVSMVSASEGWAIGRVYPSGRLSQKTGMTTLLYHFHNGKWTSQQAPAMLSDDATYLNDLAMTAADDGWLVGSSNNSVLFLHYDGTTWAPVATSFKGQITHLHMLSPNDGWALGVDFGIGRTSPN